MQRATRIVWLGVPLWALAAVLLGLWLILIDNLRIDWNVNPQYSYGWAVPALCLYLLWRRLPMITFTASRGRWAEFEGGSSSSPRFPLCRISYPVSLLSACVLAATWLPTRWLQQANPDWRLLSWALALEVIGLTVVVVRGILRLPLPLFPVFFLLVALPWPTMVETPLIQRLTQANAAATVEVVNAASVPAVQHGNTIEISAGVIGIDDACSGIRSFQATLMISLFFGELYSLGASRRVLCIAAGFALSFLFNVCRTSLLTLVASRQGMGAISKWHDPAGVTILVGCFLCLWLLALALCRRSDATKQTVTAASHCPDPEERQGRAGPSGVLRARILKLSFALGAWVLLSEAAIEMWYRVCEATLPAPVRWTVQCPVGRPGLKHIRLPERARQMFRFDKAADFAWDQQGIHWQVIFLEWNPGRIASEVVRFHNPEVCLSATGKSHEVVLETRCYQVQDLSLPFRVLRSENVNGLLFLFYCIWEDRAVDQRAVASKIDYRSRLDNAMQARRNLGQRAVEVAISGVRSFEEAETAFTGQLGQLIRRSD